MAVWGTPVAQEDDAERAVRAGLDLVAAVPGLDAALKARAGVLTGEAAVTIGAEGQGMVAGDLVNTASRIQSAAEPGTVLVGRATRRASEAAIAYEDAGEHELKGKTEPEQLFRALRVTAGRGGALKSAGLEAPFVGRDRELRLVKELYHASAEERKAQLISVIGIAGIGKSRLGWEFYKYFDGLVDQIWWHRGRCLAYGEGVAFWALAEMVRMRSQIVEGEEPAAARAKLRSTLEEHMPNAEERSFAEPRLAHLLGLEEGGSWGKEELFGAWRLLFERLSEQFPVVLLFEDLQWADASLVEFVSYLLEWSRSYPIFVICLARPELQARHPEFGQASRNQTTLFLEPLSEMAMEALLEGYVPGLPAEIREQILARAEGVPLYAVETVRMLLDRGLVAEADGVYEPTGPIEELEVPETLQGLIAARLDGLAPEERRVLQDASVLGKTFSKEALASLSGLSGDELMPLLASLVRKEVMGVQADPRSPERGQYGFLQDLVRRVAYDTLARKERKTRHLAAAAQLEESFGEAEQEVVEVVAAHYVAAYEAQPDADDADTIRQSARELLSRAGERAGSLAALGEARKYFEQAAELSDEPLEKARLLERAGAVANDSAEFDAAERAFFAALELLEQADQRHAAARVLGRIAHVEMFTGRSEQARERLERAFAAVAADEPDADVAELASRLAQSYAFSGAPDRAVEPVELALEVAQALRLPETLIRGLLVKAMLARAGGRLEEELAFQRHAVRYALEHDLSASTATAYGNLSDACFQRDRYGEAFEVLQEALTHARRVGDRRNELYLLSEMSYTLTMTGRWEEALADYTELPEERASPSAGILASVLSGVLEIYLHRGQRTEARELLSQPRLHRGVHRRPGPLDPRSSSVRTPLRGEQLRPRPERWPRSGRSGLGSGSRKPSRETGPGLGGRGGARPREAGTSERATHDGRAASAGAAAAIPRGAHAPLPRANGQQRGRIQDGRGELPRVWLPLLARRHAARARRVAGCAGENRGGGVASNRGTRDLRAAGGAPVAREARRGCPEALPRCPHDLPELRRRQPARREVLLRVRLGARPDVPERSSRAVRRTVLRRVRGGRHGYGTGCRGSLRARNRRPSAASSPSSSPTSSASRQPRSSATPRTRASSSPATSTRAGA